MEIEIQNIISLLEQTFEKGSWHGPAVKEAVENVREEQAFKRFPGTHSIIELVAHMTSWRTYVVKKLTGDADYKVSDELNFPVATDWVMTLQRLEETQKELLDALKKLPVQKLYEQVPGNNKPLTYYTLLHGIIHHDVYHAGQISLIKKSTLQAI